MRGDYGVHAGIIRNKIGAGADYASGRWKFSADVYDPNDLSVRLRGQYALTPNLFLTGQSISRITTAAAESTSVWDTIIK